MSRAVSILQNNHKGICEAIESSRERIVYMEESLAKEKERLSYLKEEAKAVHEAIGVLSNCDDDLPTRLEGSD